LGDRRISLHDTGGAALVPHGPDVIERTRRLRMAGLSCAAPGGWIKNVLADRSKRCLIWSYQ
jgi:hypothetical protein